MVLAFPSKRLGDLLTEKSPGLLTFITENADRIIFQNGTSHDIDGHIFC